MRGYTRGYCWTKPGTGISDTNLLMKTNILFVIDRLGVGGTERQLVELMGNLDRKQFCPHLCTTLYNAQSMKGNPRPDFQLGFKSFCHPSTFLCIMALARYIRQKRIAIVQTFFQDPVVLAALSKPFHHAHLVGSFRDLGFWRNRKETLKMRIAYKAYSGFIANSNAVKDHFVNVDRIEADKIGVIHNGISVGEREGRKNSKQNHGVPLVGIVANLNRPVKRVQDFIKAAAIVRRARPELRFLVVGDGYLRPQLEEFTKKLGINETVSFTGLAQKPLDFIHDFQVGVITSETEGFCNAILEYMACGVSVVATATGGNPEMVREGENGFLVPVGDVVRLADRILRLVGDDALRKKLSVANISKVKSEFSIQRMVSEHEAYYRRLLEGNGRI